MLPEKMEPDLTRIPDVNRIIVNLNDKTTPIVVLFGPQSCGKTMMTIRLTRWLRAHYYHVEPDRNFRPSNSEFYKKMCDSFDENVNSDYAAGHIHLCNFMLIKVSDKYGEPICQILEAPGDHYFDDKYPNMEFPLYIYKICTTYNPKIWMFIVERNWKDAKDRLNYANKIIKMQSLIKPSDRVMFTCHKVDLHPGLFVAGQPNVPQFFKDIENQYPGIFSKYENKNPISRLWRKYNCDFVVFSAGSFNATYEGGQCYVSTCDTYPLTLWKSITKNLQKINKNK
jgi:GTPase SAR1 family protein